MMTKLVTDNETTNISPCNSSRQTLHPLNIFYRQKNAYGTPLLIRHLFLLHSIVLLSSYFDKSHLELQYKERSRYWSRGHLIYHTAWNPEKIFDHGGYSIPFSPSTHIYTVFFPPAKSEWWQLSRRWDLWQKFSFSRHLPLQQLHLQHTSSHVIIDT